MPAVSPLACFEEAMLKGRAAMVEEMGVEVRREAVAARRERARKVDIVVGFVFRLGLLEVVRVFELIGIYTVIW